MDSPQREKGAWGPRNARARVPRLPPQRPVGILGYPTPRARGAESRVTEGRVCRPHSRQSRPRVRAPTFGIRGIFRLCTEAAVEILVGDPELPLVRLPRPEPRGRRLREEALRHPELRRHGAHLGLVEVADREEVAAPVSHLGEVAAEELALVPR